MLWVILLLASSDGWRVDETGLFQPLTRRHVAVSDRGHIYISHHTIKYVIHIDEHGKRLADIGGTGNGPGEFISSFDLFIDNGVLYVHDFWMGKVVCFDEDGHFQKKLVQPEPGLRLVKVKAGWVTLKFGNKEQQVQSRLVLTDENFGDPITLLTWEKQTQIASPYTFQPVLDVCQITVSGDGEIVFFYKPGSFTIYKIDVLERKLVTHIKSNETVIPFDHDWGKAEFAKLKKKGGAAASLQSMSLPEAFPTISDLAMSPNGSLWVEKGNQPDLAVIREYDMHAKLLKEKDSVALFRRVLAFKHGWVYLAVSGKDSEIGIQKVRWETCAKFILDNPLLVD